MFAILHDQLIIIVHIKLSFQRYQLSFSAGVIHLRAKVEQPPVMLIAYLTRCRCCLTWCMYHTMTMPVSFRISYG